MVETKRFAMALAVSLAFASACSEPAPKAPPPPEVDVVVVKAKSVANVVELPGRVQAVRTAEVRARVDGIVQRQLYTEGSDVEAGAKLFSIDPRPLVAALNAAKATLARAQATEKNAAADLDRYKPLLAKQFVSMQQYEAAVARLHTAEADVAEARAQVESAQLKLNYADVTAPIAGRVGRAQVTEGALVSATAGTLMTTIEQLDPIYVNFSQSSSNVVRIRREIATGALKVPEINRVVVTLTLEDGTAYAPEGHFDFLDQAMDEATGTVAMRAEVPNPKRVLFSGQFVRARIYAGERPGGIEVPQRAVKLTPKGATVLIVGADEVVVSRSITVGDLQGDQWIVLDGLKDGERVIVNGLQKAQPGKPVRIAAPAAAKAPATPTPAKTP